jgi:hypothetical protein
MGRYCHLYFVVQDIEARRPIQVAPPVTPAGQIVEMSSGASSSPRGRCMMLSAIDRG